MLSAPPLLASVRLQSVLTPPPLGRALPLFLSQILEASVPQSLLTPFVPSDLSSLFLLLCCQPGISVSPCCLQMISVDKACPVFASFASPSMDKYEGQC